MHVQKFVQRLTQLADSDQSLDKIVDELAKGLVDNRLTQKDLEAIVEQLQEETADKAVLHAPRKDILPDGDFDFAATETIGLQVKDGDLMYKRTLDTDLDKLL